MNQPQTRTLEPLCLSNSDLEALARHIAARLAPDALLDSADVGALLKCSARSVTEQYAKAPGFPPAIRLTRPNGRRSQPRWLRADIVTWIQAHRADPPKRGGRPRKPVEW